MKTLTFSAGIAPVRAIGSSGEMVEASGNVALSQLRIEEDTIDVSTLSAAGTRLFSWNEDPNSLAKHNALKARLEGAVYQYGLLLLLLLLLLRRLRVRFPSPQPSPVHKLSSVELQYATDRRGLPAPLG